MKKIIVLFMMVLLITTGCSKEITGKNPAGGMSDEPASQNPPQINRAEEAKPGITAVTRENYPKIDGSTSTLRIVQALYRHFIDGGGPNFPEHASKTVPSYRLLIDGDADLIIVPYASLDVLNEAKAKNVELQFYPVAAEALIFITPVENEADKITREQVRSIYLDNAIKNWQEIGGPNKDLVPICRNSNSGSQSQLDNLVLENKSMHPAIKRNYVELTMEGLLEQVAFYHGGGLSGKPTNSYALGYTLYTYLQNMNNVTGIGEHLKILAYDDVKPTVETIADGTYPLADAYYAVVRSDLPAAHSAWTLLEWLNGDEGAKAIEGLGLISMK